MKTPRRIHQMWLGSEDIRPKRWMQTWKDKNPHCEYVLWTPQELAQETFHNQWQIDNTLEFSGKCDIMRYELLYKYGGFFVDADTECTNELDSFFFRNDRFTCYEDETHGGEAIFRGLVTPSFMGCKPNDLFFDLLILEISRMQVIDKPAWIQTGPRFFTDMCNEWADLLPMKIYPSWYFVPNKPNGKGEYTGTDKTYARHYFGSTFNLYGKL